MIFIPKEGVGEIEEQVCKICYNSYREEGAIPWAMTLGIVLVEPLTLGFALMKTRDGYYYYESVESVEIRGISRHLRVFI